MITAVAFCPQAPALVPEVGRGLDAELGPVRDACRAALRRVLADGARLEVIGTDEARAIGDWLVRDTGVAPPVLDSSSTALLVLGDGSARRTEKAPGYLDERATGFDAGIAEMLASGDPARLASIDAGVGADLLAAGVTAWHQVAARLAGEQFTAEVTYDDAPFGVGYFVAVWTARA